MLNETHDQMAEQITVIVNDGHGSKILKSAKRHGIKGGTIILAMGSIRNRFLDYIGLNQLRKEVIYMLASKDDAYRVLGELAKEFEFHKQNHGIAFTTSVCSIVGSKNIVCNCQEQEGGSDQLKYQVITVIVDKGRAELAIEAAEDAGSKGGTVFNARGAGVHEVSRVFAMDVEPEKEVVLILAESDTTTDIVDSIRRKLDIDKPGNGIIYVQNANQTYGIFK